MGVGAGRMPADTLQPVENDLEVARHGVLLLLEAAKLAQQDEGPVALDPGTLTGCEHDYGASKLLECVWV
jgi:hypothetical protein